MNLRPALLLLPALLVASAAVADNRPKGKNCSLRNPPADAAADGKDSSAKVFPPAQDIDKSYSGCQLVWTPQGKGWTLREMSQYDKGELKIQYLASDALVCSYHRGKLLVGDAGKCADAKDLPRR